jgi:hypothetical protein
MPEEKGEVKQLFQDKFPTIAIWNFADKLAIGR